VARPSRALWTEDNLLQSIRSLAKGGGMGPVDGRDRGGIRRRHPGDRQHFLPGAPAGCDGKKGGKIIVAVAPGAVSTTKIHALIDRQGLPIRLGLSSVQAHGRPAAQSLRDRLDPRTIVLADKACDGNAIRDLIEGPGAVPNIPAKSNRRQGLRRLALPCWLSPWSLPC
jgi:transposase